MTFLENKDKSKTESFDEKMAVRPRGTQKAHNDMKMNFNKFCKSNYDGRSADEVLAEMVAVKDSDMDKVYGALQKWIRYNDENGIAASSILMWFSYLKKLIRHYGIKITSDDVKENLEFPKKQEEELYPLQIDEIKLILEVTLSNKSFLTNF